MSKESDHTVEPGDHVLIVHSGLPRWTGRVCQVEERDPLRPTMVSTVALDNGQRAKWTYPSSYVKIPKGSTPDQVAALIGILCPKKK